MIEKALIIIPTYNERENIAEMIDAIRAERAGQRFDILVVDSNSPDGTGRFLDEKAAKEDNLFVAHQPKKLGLGRAYLDGFRHLFNKFPGRYQAVFTMDADFSHHPRYLESMLGMLETHDLVVGSRYMPGGRLENWPRRRKILSRFANGYARFLTRVPLNDLTSGFHGFRTEALKRILRYSISADGYAFLTEIKYLAFREGLKMGAVPIIFADRTKGASKISKRVIFEAALIPWKCLFDRFFPVFSRDADWESFLAANGRSRTGMEESPVLGSGSGTSRPV